MAMRFVTDKKARPISFFVSWTLAILTLGYMLPWAISATRGQRNAWSVFWMDLLLGWTLIGWVAALVMSLNSHHVVAAVSD
jgi:hypothetical protein